MPWNTDAPLDRLNESAFVFCEHVGLPGYRDWLAQELSRVQVVMGIRVAQRMQPQPVPVVAKPTIADVVLKEMVDAVSFYADPTHWDARKRGKPAALLDEGKIARKAMEAYEGVDEGDAK